MAKARPKATSKVPSLTAEALPGDSDERAKTRTFLRPSVQAAITLRAAMHGVVEELELQALVDELADQARAGAAGELGRVEAMLVTQAHTLDALFHRLARQAIPNIGHYPDTVAVYMKLALKAQSQARSTIEALAEMKNPRSVAFVAQANVGQNVQVNNGEPPRGRAENASEPNKLLGVSDGERLDTGATCATRGSNSALEPVGTLDGTKDRRR